MGDKGFTEIVQMVMIVFFLAIPPWLALVKYFRGKVNKVLLAVAFVLYLVLTLMTQNIFPFMVVLLTIYLMFTAESESISTQNSEERFYLRPLKGKKLEVVVMSVGFKIFMSIVNLWFALFLTGFGLKLEQQKISTVFMDAGWGKVLFLSLLTVVTAPVLEEFVFRHIFYRQLSKRMGKLGAILISSILFALLHFNFLGTISFLGVGVFNCYLYDRYGYRAAVLNHFIFNGISTVLMIGYKLFGIGI